MYYCCIVLNQSDMEKKKLIVDYKNLTTEVKEAILKKYPLGWVNHMIKVRTVGDAFFYAITVDTNEASYLIKVPVKIDTKSDKDNDDLLEESHDVAEVEEKVDEEEEPEAERAEE
jgi:hypothetical protein